VRPNFLVIGAPKAATTSLWHLLRQHPDVFMSEVKEPSFFSHDYAYARGWAWYESLFAPASNETAIGEASITYCLTETYPHTPVRIAEHLPSAKLIYSVRHPLERIGSYWLQSLHKGHRDMPYSFRKAVRSCPRLLESSLYWKTVSAYRQYFPDDRLLVVFFEDFKADPRSVLAKCFRFLGVDHSFVPPDVDQPHYATKDHDMQNPMLYGLRAIPGWNVLKRLIPLKTRASLRNLWRRPLPAHPEWDTETQAWALERIIPDMQALLAYTGKPSDFWRFPSKK